MCVSDNLSPAWYTSMNFYTGSSLIWLLHLTAFSLVFAKLEMKEDGFRSCLRKCLQEEKENKIINKKGKLPVWLKELWESSVTLHSHTQYNIMHFELSVNDDSLHDRQLFKYLMTTRDTIKKHPGFVGKTMRFCRGRSVSVRTHRTDAWGKI